MLVSSIYVNINSQITVLIKCPAVYVPVTIITRIHDGTYIKSPYTRTVKQERPGFANFANFMYIPYIQTMIIIYTADLKT